jgi:predicted SnoaL-like aldol condensation-catalyzing enzyme
MKKLAFVLLAAVTCSLLSCGGAVGMSDKAQKNIDNSEAIGKMFVSGDFSKIGDYIAADAIDHAGPQGDVKGLDSLKAMFTQYESTMSDAKNETVKALGDDDYSMVWMKQSWTAKTDDPMMGLKAGERGNMESIEVCKHNADGKIAEHWSFMSMGDMMKMMQKSMPMPMEPAQKMATDTAKGK